MSGPTPGPAAAKAPPFLLPGEHFTAAVLFLVLGAIGAVVIAPDLAAGAFPSPRVVGVTHLFTLGWITTSIMGALYQFLPVALGEPIRSVRAAHVGFCLYVPGFTGFVTGLLSGSTTGARERHTVDGGGLPGGRRPTRRAGGRDEGRSDEGARAHLISSSNAGG